MGHSSRILGLRVEITQRTENLVIDTKCKFTISYAIQSILFSSVFRKN
jgi:hypothetical protein